jgi:hypothetical protein
VATVSIYDAVAEADLRTVDVPYSDGVVTRGQLSVALTDALGAYDFRVRVTTVADGGPDGSLGIDMVPDPEGQASFWIMAIGAVQESPRTYTSVTYNYTGSVQSWTVPDGVTEVTMSVAAGAGGSKISSSGQGGSGGRITGTVHVVPGDSYDVYVGGHGDDQSVVGWPNGGLGGSKPGNHAGNGGGASWMVLTGGAFTSAVLVAGGGGGGATGSSAGANRDGGAGGFFTGGDAVAVGTGATQFAGGTGYEAGDTDGLGEGGDGEGSASAGDNVGGGGGGGWHGGGGGGLGGGGGGGSGWASAAVTDLQIEDGTNTGAGEIVISWAIEED